MLPLPSAPPLSHIFSTTTTTTTTTAPPLPPEFNPDYHPDHLDEEAMTDSQTHATLLQQKNMKEQEEEDEEKNDKEMQGSGREERREEAPASDVVSWCRRNDVPKYLSSKLQAFCEMKRRFVIVFDDSSSMKEIVQFQDNKYKMPQTRTRWDEANETLLRVIDVAFLVSDRIFLQFLNRDEGEIIPVSSKTQFSKLLSQANPGGSTPLKERLEQVLALYGESPLSILIFSDGEPDDDKGFEAVLRRKPSHVSVSIFACTDNEKAMEWANDLDKNIPFLDVVDDYESEKKEVFKASGIYLSLHAYIVKGLLGAVFEDLDRMDEVPQLPSSFCGSVGSGAGGGCCSIL